MYLTLDDDYLSFPLSIYHLLQLHLPQPIPYSTHFYRPLSTIMPNYSYNGSDINSQVSFFRAFTSHSIYYLTSRPTRETTTAVATMAMDPTATTARTRMLAQSLSNTSVMYTDWPPLLIATALTITSTQRKHLLQQRQWWLDLHSSRWWKELSQS